MESPLTIPTHSDGSSSSSTFGQTIYLLRSQHALVSFELAVYCRDYGLLPAHLFVSGRRAPQIPDLDPPIHTLPEPEFWRNYAVSTERLRRYWKTRN